MEMDRETGVGRATTMFSEGIRKSRESSTVPVCVSPLYTPPSGTYGTTT